MENETTLWLPTGYGKGTIIYDIDNNPYEAVEKMMSGVDIYKIVQVGKEYAIKRIEQGASKLVATGKSNNK